MQSAPSFQENALSAMSVVRLKKPEKRRMIKLSGNANTAAIRSGKIRKPRLVAVVVAAAAVVVAAEAAVNRFDEFFFGRSTEIEEYIFGNSGSES